MYMCWFQGYACISTLDLLSLSRLYSQLTQDYMNIIVFFWIVARFEAINGQGLVRRKNVTLSFFFSCKLFVSVLVLG